MSARLGKTLLAAALALAALALPATAEASFGLSEFDVSFAGPGGEAQLQAGSHPYAMTTRLALNTESAPSGGVFPAGSTKDLEIGQIPGFVGNQTAVAPCATLEFLTRFNNFVPECPNSTVVGFAAVTIGTASGEGTFSAPLYFLQAPPHSAAKLGFIVEGLPVVIEVGLDEAPPYELQVHTRNISQVLEFFAATVTLWGTPADPSHDSLRGRCLGPHGESKGQCPAGGAEIPLLTLPRACRGPLTTSYEADSWQHPGEWVTGSALTHNSGEPPLAEGMSGCGKLAFNPEIAAQPTSRAAESSTGLDFSLDVGDEGLVNPEGTADADIEKTVVTLPEGMTANPSSAEGLGVCTEAQLARESALSAPGEGCPDASKLGTVEVTTPLLDEAVPGSLYLAKPYRNPEHTLLALYVVLKNANLGISIEIPLRVEPDPVTGQLVTTAEDLPQLPFSHFKLHFREGARSPLVTPPGCGADTVKALLYPYSGAAPVQSTSSFEIVSGPDGAPCPSGGTPPFGPGFSAGSLSPQAGAYSPFFMRLTRRDGDQDLTRFSAKLPPGMIGKLAGTAECPAQAIAQARSRTGENGGAEEKEHPSCPASSQIGTVQAGAGVGSILTYVPGGLYLAGPYRGAPLSVVAIVPALAGPFDAGTVVTQEALRINPLSAEVEADGSSSDPIPHILEGIPLKVRDIRVFVDKPDFTLNPTSCAPSATLATLWSGGADVFSASDDAPHALSSPFNAANCASLGFKPNLSLKLKGGTRRGAHPALTGTYTPRAGDANLSSLVLRLPHSAFLDQAHIRTICTRVQFAAGAGNGAACPAGAIYGQATAYTPLLDQPLSGPVFLRSSDHNLPDFVAALHGQIDVEAVARIDSKGGGIRATFPTVPDAPLSKVVVQMQGAKKGLIVNSTNLCAKPNRADAQFTGHNGKLFEAKPPVQPSGCAKHKKKKQQGAAPAKG